MIMLALLSFRAWIPARNILDLSYKPPQKKKSKAWTQAIFELNEHIRLLKERNIEVNGIKVDIYDYNLQLLLE